MEYFYGSRYCLVTPPVSEGCLNGVMRKQILELVKKTENRSGRTNNFSV
jgi:branched-subunit amino acid aminotransferase/4-amino-4-deoxychorismate lyase